MVIALPREVGDRDIPTLIGILSQVSDEQSITLDFAAVRFYYPIALTTLLIFIQDWLRAGKRIVATNLESCKALTYLQRFDFLNQCGIEIEERFRRRESKGRFQPIVRIGPGGLVDSLGDAVASCIAPELSESTDIEQTGFFDLIDYSVSELQSNVFHHAQGTGFLAAQFYKTQGLVFLSVGDNGIGIRRSFREAQSPLYHEQLTDAEAIDLALRPGVSSRHGVQGAWTPSENAGVGLTILTGLAKEAGGFYTVISGKGIFHSLDTEKAGTFGSTFPGTVCSIAFRRDRVRQFHVSMRELLDKLGVQDYPNSPNIETVFGQDHESER